MKHIIKTKAVKTHCSLYYAALQSLSYSSCLLYFNGSDDILTTYRYLSHAQLYKKQTSCHAPQITLSLLKFNIVRACGVKKSIDVFIFLLRVSVEEKIDTILLSVGKC